MERQDLMAWRRAQRADLMAMRLTLPTEEHRYASQVILKHLEEGFLGLTSRLVGFYWPFKREFNPLPFIERLHRAGGRSALPVVLGKTQPLEFRLWHPGMDLARGVYDIPYPAEGAPVHPGALLVALLGFDDAGFRLGYGGGFYDRTLAAMPERPITIAVGFSLGRLKTIHPLPHDIPMDCIITEDGVRWYDEGARAAAGL